MRDRIAQWSGAVGLALVFVGAALYAVNATQRPLMYGSLLAGLVALLVYVALNAARIGGAVRKRSARHGANMVVMIVLFATIVVVIQALSARHSYRYDLTRNKRFSLAGQTASVLDGLRDDIHIYAFFTKSAPERGPAEDLLAQYAHRSDHLRYEFIDPDQKPQRAKDMEVQNYGTTVVQVGDKTERLPHLNEEKLTNAIIRVTRDVAKVVCFVQGHGEKDPASEERDGYSIVAEALAKENYEVQIISLFDDPPIPDDCYALVIAGPTNDYFEGETQTIREYLAKGKNALFLIDPQVDLPQISALLNWFGVILDNDVVIDPFNRAAGVEANVPVVTDYEKHVITRDLARRPTLFPLVRSLSVISDAADNVTSIARTGGRSWGETDLEGVSRGKAHSGDTDIPPPLTVGLVASKRFYNGEPAPGGADESKLVVFGDSDFASNSLTGVAEAANADLILNVINFLAEEKDLISIRAKESLGDQLLLRASQGRLIFLLTVVLLPLSVIAFGGTIFVRKRKAG